ncbi:hypothetical Protein YC6258_04044 [Gynuella sunshinyii YC6258]|uniref:Uncharacterized protein n=1 Tax=Gynuella sunshinyii YC6258 TaxID=1445510 RepID=A0A0C5V9P4_9GAMM|nr:hypothetical Protein YC6258_04044 [Gynuella sunshinyii YC6258]
MYWFNRMMTIWSNNQCFYRWAVSGNGYQRAKRDVVMGWGALLSKRKILTRWSSGILAAWGGVIGSSERYSCR